MIKFEGRQNKVYKVTEKEIVEIAKVYNTDFNPGFAVDLLVKVLNEKYGKEPDAK